MKKEIKQLETIPPFYGVSYFDSTRLVAVCYPIPINLFIGFVRKICLYFKIGCQKTCHLNNDLEPGKKNGITSFNHPTVRKELIDILKNYGEAETRALTDHRLGKNISGWIFDFVEKESNRLDKKYKEALNA